LQQIRAYNVRHNYELKEFLEDYRLLLQRAVDGIWNNMVWIERKRKNFYKVKGSKKYYYVTRIIPIIPKSNEFKNHYLRNLLLNDWSYSKHYVDSAIKQAYSILKSWRRSYIKGERRIEKPIVKKRFVRIKETLYSYKNGKIKISIKPYEEYIMFDISKAWFLRKAKGEMGELILNEHYLTITFRFKEKIKTKGSIAWDCNEKSLDGFNPIVEKDKITKDLTLLFHIHRVYEIKRKRLQSLASRKISLKTILQKYSKRERNRAKDFVHKLTKEISREFKNYVHGFEDLRKKNMFSYSREHNRRIAKTNWKMITSFTSYKSKVKLLNPKNSTRRCSRCGKINAPKGASYTCSRCGLRINRQLNAAVNLYLQMEGLSPSLKLFEELMKTWSGFTLTGEEADEGFDELKRSSRLMNPKSYESQKTT